MLNVGFWVIISILISHCLLEIVSDLLNISRISDSIPDEFKSMINQSQHQTSNAYVHHHSIFGIIQRTAELIIIISFISAGGFQWLDQWIRHFHFSPILNGVIFFSVLFLAQQLISIPASAYHTFVIEEKFKFNTTTARTFVTDILKSWSIMMIVLPIVVGTVLWVFHLFGHYAWLYAWGLLTILQWCLIKIAPTIIMPLFNTFTSLNNSELHQTLTEFSNTHNFPLSGVYMMDGSKRSKKGNAFFTGFGKQKRIVLFDTLIRNHSIPELISIFAHEVGHYKHHHILKQFLMSSAVLGLTLGLLNMCIFNPLLSQSLLIHDPSLYAGMLAFFILISPIQVILNIATYAQSRAYEYEADHYAATTYSGHSLISALKKLSADNLSNLTPHPLTVFLNYSHPPILRRIQSIQQINILI